MLDVAGKRRFCLVEIETVAIGPYLDFEDLYGSWAKLSSVAENGCVLVRPDLHVAWRCAELPDSPFALLDSVMRRILGLSVSPRSSTSTEVAGATAFSLS
jgi:hypothetical protein